MSASLVGSEMCIRDSRDSAREVQGLFSGRPEGRPAKRAEKRNSVCLCRGRSRCGPEHDPGASNHRGHRGPQRPVCP
eukprot:4853902-Alexandrium_andersonii.AAC.1